MSERAKDELEIFTGNSNPALAREVCEHLGVQLGEAEVGRFPDGEVMVEVRENVRGGDCFVLQSICTPPNDNLMELLLLMDALRRASAKRITAVIPYFGYCAPGSQGRAARADQRQAGRRPHHHRGRLARAHGRSARRSDPGLLQYPGRQPLRDAGADPVPAQAHRGPAESSVVSPDAGGVERARAFARRLNANLAIIDKRRRARERGRRDATGRRSARLDRAAGRRHDRYRRHDHRGGQGGR